MKAPGFWPMVFASLVSAFSWTPIGRSSKKHYLTTQKEAVLSSEGMREAFARPFGYHNAKNLWPTFWEEARDQFNAEEMPSKYHSFCAVVAGFLLSTVLFLLAASIVAGAYA